jgi:hypothetical protein
MTSTRTTTALLLLAALLASCSDREPDAEPPVVEKPASPDDPPPHLVAKYGPPPAGGPTGRRKTVMGIEFIELKPGYVFVLRDEPHEGTFITHRYWSEVPEAVWVSRETVPGKMIVALDGILEMTRENVVEAICAKLSKGGEGRFRVPTRSEWDYAHLTGAFPAHFTIGRVSSHHPELMRGPDGELEVHWPPVKAGGVGSATFEPGFRLVWSPPEEK